MDQAPVVTKSLPIKRFDDPYQAPFKSLRSLSPNLRDFCDNLLEYLCYISHSEYETNHNTKERFFNRLAIKEIKPEPVPEDETEEAKSEREQRELLLKKTVEFLYRTANAVKQLLPAKEVRKIQNDLLATKAIAFGTKAAALTNKMNEDLAALQLFLSSDNSPEEAQNELNSLKNEHTGTEEKLKKLIEELVIFLSPDASPEARKRLSSIQTENAGAKEKLGKLTAELQLFLSSNISPEETQERLNSIINKYTGTKEKLGKLTAEYKKITLSLDNRIASGKEVDIAADLPVLEAATDSNRFFLNQCNSEFISKTPSFNKLKDDITAKHEILNKSFRCLENSIGELQPQDFEGIIFKPVFKLLKVEELKETEDECIIKLFELIIKKNTFEKTGIDDITLPLSGKNLVLIKLVNFVNSHRPCTNLLRRQENQDLKDKFIKLTARVEAEANAINGYIIDLHTIKKTKNKLVENRAQYKKLTKPAKLKINTQYTALQKEVDKRILNASISAAANLLVSNSTDCNVEVMHLVNTYNEGTNQINIEKGKYATAFLKIAAADAKFKKEYSYQRYLNEVQNGTRNHFNFNYSIGYYNYYDDDAKEVVILPPIPTKLAGNQGDGSPK